MFDISFYYIGIEIPPDPVKYDQNRLSVALGSISRKRSLEEKYGQYETLITHHSRKNFSLSSKKEAARDNVFPTPELKINSPSYLSVSFN